jgi:hypothetical protein
MTKFKLLGAGAVLSTLIATPVLAQAVVPQPGAYAFYYPGSDVAVDPPQLPREAAASARGQFGAARAMASAPSRIGSSRVSRDQEARERGARRATEKAQTNDSGVRPRAYGIEGGEVAAPPWSAACITDHGSSECGEPMWVYGSHDELARYRNAF